MTEKARLIQGNQTIVEGALYAGARFYARFPITPPLDLIDMWDDA